MKLFHIALSLFALTATAASAQEARYSIAVPYSDLNLKSDAGQKMLDNRLDRAIRTVCREHDGSVVPEYRLAVQHCLVEKRAEVAALRDRAIADYSVRQAQASR